jgi:hypothetical protein
MVAMTLVIVAVLGAVSFRFFCALDARKADVHVNASRIGLLLLESWRGAGGDVAFDPVDLQSPDLVISTGDGVDPSGLTVRGKYNIVERGVNYYATLSYGDGLIPNFPNLRTLNVIVFWPKQYPDGGFEADKGRSIRMSTYAN